MNRKGVAILGIVLCFTYFIVTFGLIISKSQKWLIAMELVTMASGILMVMLVFVFPFSKTEKMKSNKFMAITIKDKQNNTQQTHSKFN